MYAVSVDWKNRIRGVFHVVAVTSTFSCSRFIYRLQLARRALFLTLAVLVHASLSGCDDPSLQKRPAKDYADMVTIHRDAFGVPHVHGITDAAAAFGFAYAQAEDNFWQVEDNYIRAIGRASEVYGEETLESDWMSRALETETLSRREYDESSPALREILDAFAAGLNAFVERGPASTSRLLERFEPWYPLALIRYLYYQRGFLRNSGIPGSMTDRAIRLSAHEPDALSLNNYPVADRLFSDVPLSEQGSNSMAIGPSMSESGHALLFINPHLPFFGASQVYEGHVISDEGWNFSGYTRFGFPMPYVGFNEHIGWASTDNAADLADAYSETFDDPAKPLAYRYDAAYRNAEEWVDQIIVLSSEKFDTLSFSLRKTHHGPIVGIDGNKRIAVRMAKYEEPGWLDQWYAMTRAQDLESFTLAASRLDMLFGNYLYADRDGNINYVYNAAVPKRSIGFNWRGIVDGSDPRTEWDGYHSLDEIPQVLNPQSGWVQNCNSTPFLTTLSDNPSRDDYPSYMVREGDNARSRAARRILSSRDTFSFEEWTRLAYNTVVVAAEEDLPALFRDWEDLRRRDPMRAERLRSAIELLREWDRVSTVDSEAMTLFVFAGERSSGAGISLAAVERAMASLERDWSTWHVPWGEINRLQRVQSNGEGVSDSRPSIPISGVPSWAGSMFTFWSESPQGQKKRYGSGGNSYVAVVEFGSTVHALSLHTFGTSADPSSPHHFDQAPLYARGEFKPAWLTLEDVEQSAVRSYRPGDDVSP